MALRVPETDAVADCDGVRVGEDVPESSREAVTDGVPEKLREPEVEAVADCDGVDADTE